MRFAETAHHSHVLLAGKCVNYGTGREEEQGLEKGVRHQVENASGVSADSASKEHVSELRDGGIGEYALDVVLHHADGLQP